VKIKLDRTICDGFGLCAVHAPETFSLDEWGYVSLVGGGNIAPEHEDGVRRALLDCPVHAILELKQGEPAGQELAGAAAETTR
jgi:ferredoxin